MRYLARKKAYEDRAASAPTKVKLSALRDYARKNPDVMFDLRSDTECLVERGFPGAWPALPWCYAVQAAMETYAPLIFPGRVLAAVLTRLISGEDPRHVGMGMAWNPNEQENHASHTA